MESRLCNFNLKREFQIEEIKINKNKTKFNTNPTSTNKKCIFRNMKIKLKM